MLILRNWRDNLKESSMDSFLALPLKKLLNFYGNLKVQEVLKQMRIFEIIIYETLGSVSNFLAHILPCDFKIAFTFHRFSLKAAFTIIQYRHTTQIQRKSSILLTNRYTNSLRFNVNLLIKYKYFRVVFAYSSINRISNEQKKKHTENWFFQYIRKKSVFLVISHFYFVFIFIPNSDRACKTCA